ncbi:PRD domain-containing protein [Enterococcus sp. LJL128]|uniref:PRD domain-containing protein n=1 Tax=Enterococcus sp. LJL51 TaxID=3416656 RepID=UPI003CEE8B9E
MEDRIFDTSNFHYKPIYAEYTKKYVIILKSGIANTLDSSIYITLYNYLLQCLTHRTIIERNQPKIHNTALFFNQEFELAQKIVADMNSSFGLVLNEFHAAEITVLAAAAEFRISTDQIDTIITQMNEMIKLVKYRFMFHLDYNSPAGHSFIEHLKHLSVRIITNQKDVDTIDEWSPHAKEKFRLAYQCSVDIAEFLKKKYQFELTETEILFLTIHIHSLVYQRKN